MLLKLGFSVLAHLDSHLLILDEILSVGDIDFQNKCIKKIKSLARLGKTFLIVSHQQDTIQNLCSKKLNLNNLKM